MSKIPKLKKHKSNVLLLKILLGICSLIIAIYVVTSAYLNTHIAEQFAQLLSNQHGKVKIDNTTLIVDDFKITLGVGNSKLQITAKRYQVDRKDPSVHHMEGVHTILTQ